MNKNVERAAFDINKVDALMYVIENSCMDLEVMPDSQKKYECGVGAFYALWDAIRKVSDDIEKLSGDEMVIDAIYAVNDINRQKKVNN